MAIFGNATVQVNSKAHYERNVKQLNQAIATLKAATDEFEKLAAFLHAEGAIGEIADNGDSNKTLAMLGRKGVKVAEYATRLNALGALKGNNASETGINMAAHVTAISYDHETYREMFENE